MGNEHSLAAEGQGPSNLQVVWPAALVPRQTGIESAGRGTLRCNTLSIVCWTTLMVPESAPSAMAALMQDMVRADENISA